KVNQKFAVALLNKAGHQVEIAENGLQAVEAVRRGDFDVVLMDVQMPELDGIQATQQIRALPAPKCDIHIIALTADAMSGAKEQYLHEGMDDYVSKPIQPVVLLARLAELALTLDGSARADVKGKDEVVTPSVSETVLDEGCLATLNSLLSPEDLTEFLQLFL